MLSEEGVIKINCFIEIVCTPLFFICGCSWLEVLTMNVLYGGDFLRRRDHCDVIICKALSEQAAVGSVCLCVHTAQLKLKANYEVLCSKCVILCQSVAASGCETTTLNKTKG